MARLDIPEDYREGLAKLVSLNDESFQELLSALEKTPLVLRYRTVAANIAPDIKTVPQDDVKEIVEILVGLNIVRSGADVTTPEFVNDLSEALDETGIETLKLTGERRDRVKQWLAQLLDAKPLEVSSKARSLQIEHDRRYCSARIINDIRPVFGSNPEEAPMAAVVTSTLRISFHEGEDLKDIFFAMDADDLKQLKESIERAEKKATALKAVLDKAKVSYLE